MPGPGLEAEYDENEVRSRAVKLLARREHSRLELAGKLGQRGYAPAMVSAVVDQLAEQGLVDDRRFASAYAHSRVERGIGPRRIAREFGERGISGALIDEALAAYRAEWPELLARVREKRFGRALPTDYKERMRQARFLEYRGFDSAMIMELLGG